VEIEFAAVVVFWRGPAPWHFVRVPGQHVPATVVLGSSTWSTSLWPKDGGYLVPLKTAARRAEGVEVDSAVTVRLRI
jgi:hypothetical protein